VRFPDLGAARVAAKDGFKENCAANSAQIKLNESRTLRQALGYIRQYYKSASLEYISPNGTKLKKFLVK